MKPKNNEVESFEYQEYGEPQVIQDRQAIISQLVQYHQPPTANYRVNVSFEGELMKVWVSSYEINLPQRMKQVDEEIHQVLDSFVKWLKKEYRKHDKEALNLKEKKEMADFRIEKVNLNARYYYTAWRFYEYKEPSKKE